MKKILSILMAVLCIVGCGTIAFAEGEGYDYTAYCPTYCDENGNLKYGINGYGFIYCKNCSIVAHIGYDYDIQEYTCDACHESQTNSNHIYFNVGQIAYGFICPDCGEFSASVKIHYDNENDRIDNVGNGEISLGICLHCERSIRVADVKVYRFTSQKIKDSHIPAVENTEYMYGDGHDENTEDLADATGGLYNEWKKGYYNSFQHKVDTFFKNLIENIKYFFSRLFSY